MQLERLLYNLVSRTVSPELSNNHHRSPELCSKTQIRVNVGWSQGCQRIAAWVVDLFAARTWMWLTGYNGKAVGIGEEAYLWLSNVSSWIKLRVVDRWDWGLPTLLVAALLVQGDGCSKQSMAAVHVRCCAKKRTLRKDSVSLGRGHWGRTVSPWAMACSLSVCNSPRRGVWLVLTERQIGVACRRHVWEVGWECNGICATASTNRDASSVV
jgi:hypothetical protein